jgi:DNA polymerase III epsilon subunit-like protein
MATTFNSSTLPPHSAVIVYDLEAIGDVTTPETCMVWNIAAMVLGKGDHVLEQYVLLPVELIPPPPHEDLFNVTHDFLREANAVSMQEAVRLLWRWAANFYKPELGGVVVLVSHGNFRFDKPLLEAEHVRYQCLPPASAYFFDTLHWFRSLHRKAESYALAALYRHKFSVEIKNQHLAVYDVYALAKLIRAEEKPMTGLMYPMFYTPLLRIPSVGLHTQRMLVDKGEVYSVQDLVAMFRNEAAYDTNELVTMLVKRAGILKATATNIASYIVANTT